MNSKYIQLQYRPAVVFSVPPGLHNERAYWASERGNRIWPDPQGPRAVQPAYEGFLGDYADTCAAQSQVCAQPVARARRSDFSAVVDGNIEHFAHVSRQITIL